VTSHANNNWWATQENYSSNFDDIDGLGQQKAIIDERKSITKSTTTAHQQWKNGENSVGCMCRLPESVERSAIVDKFKNRMWLDLPCICHEFFKKAVLPVDLWAFAVWSARSYHLQTCNRMHSACRFLYNCDQISIFLFCSRHLFSLQSCNGCNHMWLQRDGERPW
jgi:hypothetical protein